MFIQQLIKSPMGFSKYFQWIKFYSGKGNLSMNLLSLLAGSRGSCRNKSISLFVCKPCPRSKVSQNLGPFARLMLLSPGNFVQTPATIHWSVIPVSKVLVSLFLWLFTNLCHTPRHWSFKQLLWRKGLYHLHGYVKKKFNTDCYFTKFLQVHLLFTMPFFLRSVGLSSAAW